MSYHTLLRNCSSATIVPVVIHKGICYRIYPTAAQIRRLFQWEGALRQLWNAGNEQRRIGLARCGKDKRYPTAYDQIKELTQLRAELPWLADVPRNVCSQLLVDLDQAYQRCFKRLTGFPHDKRKGRDTLGLTETNPIIWRIDGNSLRFPKLGNVRTVVHRPLEGKPKACTVRRDGDQWFASIVCEIEIPDPAPRVDPVVAIDRGVMNLIADSDGRLVPNPRFYERTYPRLRRAQRVVSRRQKGSKNREKAKLRVMRLHRKVRRHRAHVLHELSAAYAKSHGTVVVEKLNVKGMLRSRCGHSVANMGWSAFGSMLGYKLAWSGGTLVEVPAAYSSQTCSECGAVNAESRHRERFCCTSCGHQDHADLNAAKVLKARYACTRANRSGLPVEASGSNSGLRSRKLKVRLRVPRRRSSESHAL